MSGLLPVWLSAPWALLVVAAATALAWRFAAAVLAAPASPTLPEQLQRWRGQHQRLIAMAIAGLLFAGVHALWAIPAIWLAMQVFAHRVRRVAFGDTWTLAAQLAWNLRVLAGALGFWWAVLLAPLPLVAVEAPVWVALAAGVLLLAWNHFYGDLLVAAFGATPLRRPELDAVFEPVLARVRVPRPRLLRAGPRGALVANAFALSSPRGDIVLFLDALLDHASPAEAAGILAHELGHLEDFATRRAGLYAHGALLAAGAVGVTLGAQAVESPYLRWTAAAAWLAAAAGSLIARAVRSQHRETQSDRRAVELCGGDGEALVQALILLHTIGLVPRRFAPDVEQHATHPSLARRIRAIRAASGLPPDLLEPRAFRAAEPTRAAVFERQRLVFVAADGPVDVSAPAAALTGTTQLDAIPYDALTELRLEPGRVPGAVLVAAARNGTRHRLSFAEADVPALQAMLDLADQRIAVPTPKTPDALAIGRLLASIAAIAIAASATGVAMLVVGLVAIALPTPGILAALGAGALVSAVLPGTHPTALHVAGLVVAGLACFGAARLRHVALRERPPASYDGPLVVAQVTALFLIAMWPTIWIALLGRLDPADLHVAARAWSGAAPAWAALGAMLLGRPRRWLRVAAAPALLLAIAILLAGTDMARARIAPDPLIAEDAPALERDPLPAEPLRRLRIDGTHVSVRLSPDGGRVVLLRPADGDMTTNRYVVAAFDGGTRVIEAHDVRFVDADTLLTVRDEDGARVLAAERVADGAVQWSLRLTDAPHGHVEVDTAGHWRLSWHPLGDRDSPAAGVVLEGRVGEATVRRRATPTPPQGAYVASYGGGSSGSGLLVRRYLRPGASPLAWRTLGLTWSTEIARVAGSTAEPLARSRLDVRCFGPTLASSAVTCLAGTDDETFVWSGDAERGALRPVAMTVGWVVPDDDDPDQPMVWIDDELLMLWPGERRALRISDRERCPCPFDAAYASGRVATLTSAHDATTVDLYAVTPPASGTQVANRP